jgi:putative endonuclease
MFGDDKTTIEVGATGEDRAVDHLVRQGYRIVERNFRCKLGELDIIARDPGSRVRTDVASGMGPREARDRGVLVFVEVRSRRNAEYGSALDAVSWHKRRKVSRVAMNYIAYRKPRFDVARFDVIAITGAELVHIKDAWRL